MTIETYKLVCVLCSGKFQLPDEIPVNSIWIEPDELGEICKRGWICRECFTVHWAQQG